MRWRVGSSVYHEGQFQWAPTLTSHDPNPPIPLETATGGGPIEIPTGLATETDAALAVGLQKRAATGFGAEGDSALANGIQKQAATGLAAESDSGIAPVLRKQLEAGVAEETESALALELAKTTSPGPADESDAAFACALRRTLTVEPAEESDSSLALQARKDLGTGTALEADEAWARPFSGAGISTGVGQETDEALAPTLQAGTVPQQPAVGGGGGRSRRPAEPIRELRRPIERPVEAAQEIDEAMGLRLVRRIFPGRVRSLERAVAIQWVLRIAVRAPRTRRDSAIAARVVKHLSVRAARIEGGMALAPALHNGIRTRHAASRERALALTFRRTRA